MQGPYCSISAFDRGDDYDEYAVCVAYVFVHPLGEKTPSNRPDLTLPFPLTTAPTRTRTRTRTPNPNPNPSPSPNPNPNPNPDPAQVRR